MKICLLGYLNSTLKIQVDSSTLNYILLDTFVSNTSSSIRDTALLDKIQTIPN